MVNSGESFSALVSHNIMFTTSFALGLKTHTKTVVSCVSCYPSLAPWMLQFSIWPKNIANNIERTYKMICFIS